MAKKRLSKMDKLKKEDDRRALNKEYGVAIPESKNGSSPKKHSKTKKIEVTHATERKLKSGETRISIYETYIHHGMKGRHPLGGK